jgi:hypothetical protein
MTTRFRDFSIEEYWNLAWPFLCLLGLGLAIRAVTHWWPQDVAIALGDALMVAGAIGVAFELYATRFLIEQVAKDLSGKLVGRGLPSELQSHIRTIVETDFVRENYVKAYSLSDSEHHTGSLVLDITVSFDVKNYSDSGKTYIPVIHEETFYRPEFKDLEYSIVGGEFHHLNAAELSLATKTDPKTNVKTVSVSGIKLEPFRRNEKAVCKLVLKYRLQMPEEYSDVTNFAGATIGAIIRIDKIPDRLDFVSTGEHTDGSKSWYFGHPFISGQHVRAWWFKKKKPPQQDSST